MCQDEHHRFSLLKIFLCHFLSFSFHDVSNRFRSSDEDESGWKTMRVQPIESRAFSIYTLLPEVEYEFQVFAANTLGRGQGSDIIRARTKSKSEMELSSKFSSSGILKLFYIFFLSFFIYFFLFCLSIFSNISFSFCFVLFVFVPLSRIYFV